MTARLDGGDAMTARRDGGDAMTARRDGGDATTRGVAAGEPMRVPRAARDLALLTHDDLPWVGALTDVVVRNAGQPWRLALEQIEAGAWMAEVRATDALGTDARDREARDADARDREARDADARDREARGADAPDRDARGGEAWSASARNSDTRNDARNNNARTIPPRRVAAAVHALRRLVGGRPYRAALARRARELVLGIPALTDDVRAGRLAAAGAILDLSSGEVEQTLWADLPSERPIALPTGRPPSAEVAALANVALVQRALRRAHSIELRVCGDAGPLLRAAAARGLLAATSRSGDHTVLEIIGPLALCHGTTVYGRALGQLVPLLGACSDFALTIHAEARGHHYQLAVRSPALLPVGTPPRPWRVVANLARELEGLGMVVDRAPAPLVAGSAVVCPDLRVHCGTRVIAIEVIGFWTAAFLARKVARYRAAGMRDVILCVDVTRACDDTDGTDDPPPGACVVRFERRIAAGALVQLMGGAVPG